MKSTFETLSSLLSSALCLLACGCSSPDFEANCEGDTVANCLPFEVSLIESATVTPDAPVIDDPSVLVHIELRFAKCERAPRPHEITLRMRVGEEESAQILDILTLRDDGVTEGDEAAMDGVIDIEIPSPFLGNRIPANTNVFLRFESRLPADCSSGECIGGTCRSSVFEIPFRTGERLTPEG